MNFRLRSYTSTAASHDASTVTSPGDCGYEVIASTIVAAFPSSMSTIFKYHVFNFHAVTALPYIVTTFKIWLSWNERTIIALCLATLQESKATATALFYVCLQCEKPKINKGLNLQIVIIYRVQLDLLPPFVLCSPLCPCFAAARPWLPWISCGAEQMSRVWKVGVVEDAMAPSVPGCWDGAKPSCRSYLAVCKLSMGVSSLPCSFRLSHKVLPYTG
jgi:hypothetical protein